MSPKETFLALMTFRSGLNVIICDGENYLGYDSTGTHTTVDPLEFGCDSTTIINLEAQEIILGNLDFEACEGDQLVIFGTVYIFTESFEIMDTTFGSEGCISLLTTIAVTVNPTQTIDIDTTICEGLSFLGLSESGEYSLDSINEVGCTDTYSILLTVLPLSDPLCTVGVEDLSANEISIYPNPTRDQFFIEGENEIESISIYTLDYKKVDELKVLNRTKKLVMFTENLSEGLYLVAIKSGGILNYKKLVVER